MMLKASVPGVFVFSGLFLIAVIISPACTTGSCLEETESAAMAGFYETGTGIAIAPVTVTVYGLGMESDTLYLNAANRKDLLLPLNPAAESSSFVLIANGIKDTITFTFFSFPHLISKECGYSMYNTIETCTSTHNLIDTVFIQNPNVTTKYNENIRIFF